MAFAISPVVQMHSHLLLFFLQLLKTTSAAKAHGRGESADRKQCTANARHPVRIILSFHWLVAGSCRQIIMPSMFQESQEWNMFFLFPFLSFSEHLSQSSHQISCVIFFFGVSEQPAWHEAQPCSTKLFGNTGCHSLNSELRGSLIHVEDWFMLAEIWWNMLHLTGQFGSRRCFPVGSVLVFPWRRLSQLIGWFPCCPQTVVDHSCSLHNLSTIELLVVRACFLSEGFRVHPCGAMRALLWQLTYTNQNHPKSSKIRVWLCWSSCWTCWIMAPALLFPRSLKSLWPRLGFLVPYVEAGVSSLELALLAWKIRLFNGMSSWIVKLEELANPVNLQFFCVRYPHT